uniref:Transmembrane protein 188 n=1 Tax=Lutzomyia longipalpis TaxID=7200 RepID=A0A1B0CKA3_LUTLO
MSQMEQSACEVILFVLSTVTALGAWYWLTDPRTSVVPFTESLLNHPIFTVGTLILIMLFACGIHRLVIAPQIITSRTRAVLNDFNMSCDDTGKLILRPRPTN